MQGIYRLSPLQKHISVFIYINCKPVFVVSFNILEEDSSQTSAKHCVPSVELNSLNDFMTSLEVQLPDLLIYGYRCLSSQFCHLTEC